MYEIEYKVGSNDPVMLSNSFDTKAKRTAFLKGLQAGVGWMNLQEYQLSDGRKAFQITGEDEFEEAMADPDRVVARYVKQEKIHPSGRIHHLGEEYWDVTSVIDEMDREEVFKLRDYDYSTDAIVHNYSDHKGPHEVEVVYQALNYIDATEEEIEKSRYD
jgi:hypothetical protein